MVACFESLSLILANDFVSRSFKGVRYRKRRFSTFKGLTGSADIYLILDRSSVTEEHKTESTKTNR